MASFPASIPDTSFAEPRVLLKPGKTQVTVPTFGEITIKNTTNESLELPASTAERILKIMERDVAAMRALMLSINWDRVYRKLAQRKAAEVSVKPTSPRMQPAVRMAAAAASQPA